MPTPPFAHTLICPKHSPVSWHRGRMRYAVWLLPVKDETVLRHWRAAQNRLSPWLWPDYQRQAHLTLAIAGFPCAAPRYADDVALGELLAVYQKLRQTPPVALSLKLGALESFASAPYLAIEDPDGAFARLSAALEGQRPQFRQQPARAHLTLGLYAQKLSWAQLSSELEQFASPQLSFRCTELVLASYDSHNPRGPLRYDLSLPLRLEQD